MKTVRLRRFMPGDMRICGSVAPAQGIWQQGFADPLSLKNLKIKNPFQLGDRQRLILFVQMRDPQSQHAVALVQSYDPAADIIYAPDRGDRVMPCLLTPLGTFEGISDIRRFLDEQGRSIIEH